MCKSYEDIFHNEANSKNEKSDINDEDTNNMFELLKSLKVSNISYAGLIIVLIAVIINIKYIEWNRVRILDSINNTNFAEKIEDLNEAPKLTNRLYLISTIMFMFIIYDEYITQISLDESQKDDEAICAAWKKYVAIILFLIGTLINYSVLNRPNN